MKKTLLLGAAAMAAISASAIQPTVYDDLQIVSISPDGKYIASELLGVFTLIDLETGQKVVFEGDPYGTDGYSCGQGTAFAKDGTMAGSYFGAAAYLKDGEWHDLEAPTTQFTNYAQGISPDGSIIVGSTGLAKMSTDDIAVPMQVPVIWERKEDGTYGKGTILPYPEKDFSGRVPQYVTAMCVTEDNNTIVGQVVDYSGMMSSLITYTRNDNNEWEYNASYNKMLNPKGNVFPEDPGECPEAPQWEDFMTEEEIAAFNDAVTAYWDGERDEYPKYEDFATPEEVEAYNAAKAAWDQAFEEWSNKYNAFDAVMLACTLEGNALIFNNIILSGDGKKILSTTMKTFEDPDSWTGLSQIYTPVVIDLASTDYTVYPADNILGTSITNDGAVFGYSESTGIRQAMVYLSETAEPMTLLQYYKAAGSETATWMEENMLHDVEAFDMESFTTVFIEDAECTGCPYVTPDASVIATAMENVWYDDESVYLYSYVLPGATSAVKGITTENDIKVSALKGGRIMIAGEAETVSVFDMDGRMVFNAPANAGIIETGLTAGAYIVRVTTAKETKAIKALF